MVQTGMQGPGVIRWREALVRTANETNASLVGNGVIGSWIPFHGNTVSLFLTRFVPANVHSMSNRNSGNAWNFVCREPRRLVSRCILWSRCHGGGPFPPVFWVSKFFIRNSRTFWMDLKFVVAENKVELDGCEIFQKEKIRGLEWWCKIGGGRNYFI